jgi:UDPglucose--hexose-1-phosphate uridylyltransferase
MSLFDINEHPHRRRNALTGEWVTVSPHRLQRPWQGRQEELPPQRVPEYDPDCYLCPGNKRAGRKRNPQYEETFVFDNDFPALSSHTPRQEWNKDDLLVTSTQKGICRVLCFSPRHDLSIPHMNLGGIRTVVDAWVDEYRQLAAIPWVRYVQIFENRGTLMGCSNPHPHCQIWAVDVLPSEVEKEQRAQLDYRHEKDRCLLCHYWELERRYGERLILENESFAVLVPFWAAWPFETLVVSKAHVGSLGELPSRHRTQLAEILKRLTTRYDNLFRTHFPYSMGFHQSPCDGDSHLEWHLHVHFYPPLLRSATVRKFMVGYEMLGEPQRDFSVEYAAEQLRTQPERHFLAKLEEMDDCGP